MQDNAQGFGTIFGCQKRAYQRGRMVERSEEREREKVNDKSRQEKLSISVEKIRKQCRKIANWKAPERDGVQWYWIKNLSSLHGPFSSQMNRILMGEDDLPKWMTHGRTVLCQKNPKKVIQLIIMDQLHASH